MLYKIELTEEKIMPHQVTTLHLINGLAYIVAGSIINAYNFEIRYWGLALLVTGLFLLIATIFRNKWIQKPKVNVAFRMIELLIGACFVSYSLFQNWKFPAIIFGVLAAATAFAIFWERTSNKKQYIVIDNEGLQLPVSARSRFIQWWEAEQVLLKFGTLSIDCLDNRLYQWNIIDNDLNVDEIEIFCRKAIADNIDKRTKNNW